MGAVKDLDVLVPDDLSVKFGGVTYAVPGDFPLVIFLRVNRIAQESAGDQVKEIEGMIDCLVDLFTWNTADLDVNEVRASVRKVLERRGVRFAMQLLGKLYGEEPEPEADPTPEPALPEAQNGTTSTNGSTESPSQESSPATPAAVAS